MAGCPEGASEEAPRRALEKASVSDTHTPPQDEPEEQGASRGLWACVLCPDAGRVVAQGAPALAHRRSPGGQDRGQNGLECFRVSFLSVKVRVIEI